MSPLRNRRAQGRAPCCSGGFTLVEMIITLTVFVLLSAAIFGIITGVLKSAGSLQDNQNRRDQSMAQQAYLQNQVSSLPGRSALISYRRGDGEGLDQNGIIYGVNNTYTALDAKVQANGLYTLRVATFSGGSASANAASVLEGTFESEEDSLHWRNLVSDVQHVNWRFQNLTSQQWSDSWNTTDSKPNLIEFSMQIAGDRESSVTDLWIPTIYAPPVFSSSAIATPNAQN